MIRKRLLPYAFIAPAACVIAVAIGIPVLQVFVLAVSQTNKIGDPVAFGGIANFQRLFADPLVVPVLEQTGIWTFGILIPATIMSVALALVLNERFRGRAVARAIVFAPWAVSFVFVAVIWRLIFDPFFGHLDALLSIIVGSPVTIAWLAKPTTAMMAVIWVGITLTVPFTTIVTLSGLQAIPQELLEAASLDGAGSWARFRYVTLPLLQPVLVVATLVNPLAIFNSFPIIWTMTTGGPSNSTDTFATYLYKIAFWDLDFGKAAAFSVVGLVILLVISGLYVRSSASEVF